jgi:heme A synthase
VVSVQLLLGITTLLLAVPIALGALHQFTGVLALTAALVATQRAGGVTWESVPLVAMRSTARVPGTMDGVRGTTAAPLA